MPGAIPMVPNGAMARGQSIPSWGTANSSDMSKDMHHVPDGQSCGPSCTYVLSARWVGNSELGFVQQSQSREAVGRCVQAYSQFGSPQPVEYEAVLSAATTAGILDDPYLAASNQRPDPTMVAMMAGYVYCGSCVEPGGFALDDHRYEDECPQCKGKRASYRSWETNDGGCLNLHWSVNCPDCGHEDGDPFAGDP